MNYFKDIELFSDLSETDQTQLSDFCQQQSLSKWETLFSQWDEPQAMYIISSGRVLVQKQVGEDIKNIALLGEWDLVGEMAFFGNPPVRTATVIADSESTILVIIRFSVEQMMKKYPDLYEKVRIIIEERSA